MLEQPILSRLVTINFPCRVNDRKFVTILEAVSQIGDSERSAKFYHLNFGSNTIQPITDHPYGSGAYPHEGRAVGTFKGK